MKIYEKFQSEMKKMERKYLSEDEVQTAKRLAGEAGVKIDFAYYGPRGAPDENPVIRGFIFPRDHTTAELRYMDASDFFSTRWRERFKG